MKKLLLVDGTNMAYRWFSNPPKMLEYFHSTVLSLGRSWGTNAILVCFDNKASSFRKGLLPEYKGHRTKNLTEEELEARKYFYELIKQLPEILANHGIPCLALEHIETDDILAYVCKHYHTQCDDIVIVSSDKDLYQLCQFFPTRIYSLTKQEWMDKKIFEETYGMPCEYWVYVKALSGDTSDNIPGIHLVGEKRAIGYVTQYGPSYDEIYKNLSLKKKKGKIDQAVLDSREIVERNMKLVDLVTHCDDILNEYDEYIEIIHMFLEGEGFTNE